jgi:hypothetical protein
MSLLTKMCFKSTLIILCLIFSSFKLETTFYIDNSSVGISIENAIKNNIISCSITSSGGYKGNCIDVEIVNLKSRKIIINIEAGRNFESKDTTAQDILVVKEQFLVLNAGETKQTKVFGFCSQSHNSSPENGSQYSVGKMKDKETVLLAQFLGKNDEYPISAMQKAVWAVTNQLPIASIFNEDRDSILSLQKFVSNLIKSEMPWYSINYVEREDNLFTDEAKSIHGVLEKELEKDAVIKVVVYDVYNTSHNRIEFTVEEDSGSHPIVVNVSNLPKGKYYVRFFQLGVGRRLEEKVINI